MEIQDRIKERRKALGLTLKDVAKALGVSEGTVSRYESADIQNMGVNKLTPLARVLRCSPVYLLLGNEEDSPEGTAASSTAAPVSMDPRKNAIDHYYPNLSDESKDELLKRCVELVKLDSMNAGNAEVPRRSLDYDDSASIA